MAVSSRTIILAAAMTCLHGQVTDAPRFEVASVKVAPPIDQKKPPSFECSGGPGTADPGIFTCSYATLKRLIVGAYDLRPFQVPDAAPRDRLFYNISAKVPTGTTKAQFQLMQRNLLADRFKLTFHYDKKESIIYDLAIANSGLKMKPSPLEDPAEAAKSVTARERDEYGFLLPAADYRGTSMGLGTASGIGHWVARAATMEQIVRLLSNVLKRPVTDLTGLQGKYDFTLNFSSASLGSEGTAPPPDAARPAGGREMSADDVPSLFAAMRDQLGLKLQSKKGTIEILVVDHLEKTPVEN